jgi:hypothetical protein
VVETVAAREVVAATVDETIIGRFSGPEIEARTVTGGKSPSNTNSVSSVFVLPKVQMSTDVLATARVRTTRSFRKGAPFDGIDSCCPVIFIALANVQNLAWDGSGCGPDQRGRSWERSKVNVRHSPSLSCCRRIGVVTTHATSRRYCGGWNTSGAPTRKVQGSLQVVTYRRRTTSGAHGGGAKSSSLQRPSR